MKREIPQEWREEHQRYKQEWKESGSKEDFYFWLLEKVEANAPKT